MKSKVLFLLTISLLASGCASVFPEPTPTPTNTPMPTATYTPEPTETPTPTTDPMSLCAYDADFFARLKAALPLDEIVIYRQMLRKLEILL